MSWNEKLDLHEQSPVTAKEYAQNAVLVVGILLLILIASEAYRELSGAVTQPPQIELKASEKTLHKVSLTNSALGNTYWRTSFRYTGTIPHIDKSQTEKM